MKQFPGKSLQLSIGQLISVAGLTGVWCTFASGGHVPDFRWVPFGAGAAGAPYYSMAYYSIGTP